MKTATKSRVVTLFPLGQPDPSIIEYERALIGGCLADTRGIKAWPALRPEEFYLDRHRTIWEAMLDLTETTDHPTLLDVTEALQRLGHLDEVGGRAAIAEMIETGIAVFDLQGYGMRVRQSATERAKQKFAADLASNPTMSQSEIERVLRDLESGGAVASGSPIDVLQAERERLQRESPLFTNLPNIDRKTNGLHRGQVLVIGGRTSHGKTTFAAFLAQQFAKRGISVDYLTLEERDVDIVAKWTAAATRVPVWRVLSGPLDRDEEQAVNVAATELGALPLQVLTTRSHYESEAIAAVEASKAEVVFLDHIQQVVTADESRTYGLERVMSRLAAIAVADRKLVVVCAQINRGIDGRKEAPTLADLRDSGGIEQVARTVWLVYWPIKHNPKRAPTEYEVCIAKASNGPTGIVALHFEYQCGRFEGGEPDGR